MAKANAKLDLLTLRERAGYVSRTDFAKACGVTPVTTWRWETGRRRMDAKMCKRVAKVLGVSMETVLEAVS